MGFIWIILCSIFGGKARARSFPELVFISGNFEYDKAELKKRRVITADDVRLCWTYEWLMMKLHRLSLFNQHINVNSNLSLTAIRKWLTWRSRCDAVHLSTAIEFRSIQSRTTIFQRLHHSVGSCERRRAKPKTKLTMRSCQSHRTMKIHRQTTTIWTVELLKHQNCRNRQRTTSAEHHRVH